MGRAIISLFERYIKRASRDRARNSNIDNEQYPREPQRREEKPRKIDKDREGREYSGGLNNWDE